MKTSGRIYGGSTCWSTRVAMLAALAFAVPFAFSESQAQVSAPGETRMAQGTVRILTTAPMGEVDGALLDDGTVIHWPPHLADRFRSVVARGDHLKVSGRMETGPEGDSHLEVQTVTNLRTNTSIRNDDIGPLPGPERAAADDSDDFAVTPGRPGDVERRIKAMEDQIEQLRAEIRRLRREP
jgi:hypothetical protein